MPWRGIGVVAAVAVAYHFSLLSVLRGVGLQTPLAYLAFVPVMALVLAALRLERPRVERPIHDRQLDYIIGLALLVVAAAVAYLGPLAWPIAFWMLRIDLLSVPLFAGGVVALVYGVRALWRLRWALAFLLLVWPAPYVPVLGEGMRASVDLTVAALAALTSLAPFLGVAPGGDGIFFLSHAGGFFPISVASACSGANSIVAFLLLGSAVAVAAEGPPRSRLLWLATGLVATWLANLARIVVILLAGNAFGPNLVLDLLHPVAGLLFFNAAVVAMLLALPRFGSRFAIPTLTLPAVRREPVVRNVRGALLVSAGFAVLLGLANGGLARYEVLANGFGEARLRSFDLSDVRVPMWEGVLVAEYQQGKQYFGADSEWRRYLYSWLPGATLRSESPVYVDIIDASDLQALSAYGLEACYRFHGYAIQARHPVDIGAGIRGELVRYQNPRFNRDWTALWWEWPYRAGTRTMYERVVVFVSNGRAGDVQTDEVLRSLARAMVEGRAASSLAAPGTRP